MAQEFVQRQVGHTLSVYILDGGHTTSAALEALVEKRHEVSVVVYGPEVSERRLTGSISVTERLPDVFYGFSEESSGAVQIENFDGALNFLLDEDNRGQPIRIRRYDQENQELTEVYTGTLDSVKVADYVDFEMSSHRLDVFDVEYPRNRVYTITSDHQPSLTDVDVTSVFPEATDINEPIPIVFGRVRHLPLSLVKSDTTAKEHEYLVCEGGNVEVETVYRSGRPTHTETGIVTSITYPGNKMVLAADARGSESFYKDLYVRIIQGDGVGEANTKLISAYDPVTREVTVDEDWTTGDDGLGPDIGSTYEITEYKMLRDTAAYRRRTAIRFRYAQKQNGQLLPMSATVARYHHVERNLLHRTEEFDHEAVAHGVPTGWWYSDDGIIVTPDVVYAPDGTQTADELYLPAGGSELIAQTISFGAVPSGDYTFSIWLRVREEDSPVPVALRIIGSTATLSYPNVTSTWTRYSVTKSSGFQADNDVQIINQSGSAAIRVYAWGAQFEKGGTPSAYFPVCRADQGFRWSFPDAIKEMLSDPVFGLRVPVNPTSFAQANTDLDGLYLKCQGSIPSIRGQAGTGKRILDEMLRVRGMRLYNSDSLWNLSVDTTQSTIGILGSAETPQDNIREVGALRHKPVDQIVKTVILRYNLDRKEDENLETIFKGELSAGANDTGVEETIESQFIRDFGTADRTVQYLAGKFVALATTRDVTVGQVGRVIAVGNVLTLNIPRRMTENRLKYSEDLTQGSVWQNQGSSPHPTVSLVDGRNYFEKGQRLSQVSFPTGSVARQDDIYQDVDVAAAAGMKVTFTCWIRAVDNPITDQRLQFRVTNGGAPYETAILEPDIGTGWKKITVGQRFTSAAGGTAVRVQIMRNSSNPLTAFVVQIANMQLTFDYDYQYVKTEATAKPVQELWQVTEVQHAGIDQVDLELIPYLPNTVFAYTQGDPPPAGGDTSSEDESLIPPDPPGDIVMPPAPPAAGQPPSSTASAGVAILPDGSTDSWGAFTMNVPETNVKRIDLQRRQTGEIEYETISSLDVDDDILGTNVVLVGHKFTPGLEYDIRAVSVNERNLWTASAAQQWVAHGDRKAPIVVILGPPADVANSDRLTVSEGTGRTLEIQLVLSGSSIPADLGTVKIYRSIGTTFIGESLLINQSKGLRFHDTNLTVGLQYYYWARIVDLTGNESDVIGNGNSTETDGSGDYPRGATTGAALTGVQTAEIEDAAITNVKIGTAAIETAHIGALQVTNAEIADLNADKITAGTITVGDSAGQVDAIKIYRGAASELAFWDTTGADARRAYINITAAGGLGIYADNAYEIDLFLGGSSPETTYAFEEIYITANHNLELKIGETVDPLRPPQWILIRAGVAAWRGMFFTPSMAGWGVLPGSVQNITAPASLSSYRIPVYNNAGTLLGYIALHQ
jgi:hypothetical protein